MFRNTFQGSDSFHITGPVVFDKRPILKGIFGGAVKCVYSEKLRSHVVQLSLRSKKISYHSTPLSLSLTQDNLVIQVYLESNESVSIDLVVIDSNHCRRKIRLSTSRKSLSVLPALIQSPLRDLKRSTWVNMCLPLSQLMKKFWPGQKFHLLDGIYISGNCCIREIFTTKNSLTDTFAVPTDDNPVSIPKAFRYPMSLENATQTFGPQRILSQNDQVPVETEVSVVAICKPKMNNTKAITVKDILGVGSHPGSSIFVAAKVFNMRRKPTETSTDEMKLIRAIPRPFWLSKKRKPTAALAEAFSFDQKLCPVEDEFAQVPELMALEHQIEMTLNGPDETVMSEGTSEDFSLILDSKYFYSYATNKFYPMPF